MVRVLAQFSGRGWSQGEGAFGLDRVAPEGGVGFRLGGVDRATVPETAVDEDDEFQFGKNKVGFARKLSPVSASLIRRSRITTNDRQSASDHDLSSCR